MGTLRTLRDGYRWLVDPYGFLDEALERHGLTFRIRLPVLGDVLMTGDDRLIAQIVSHRALEGGKAVDALRAILGGRSLIMLEGEAHATRRRLLAPSFSGDSLAAHDELTVRITREVLCGLPAGPTFSLYPVLRRIGLRVMVALLFGADSAAASAAEQAAERFLTSFRNPLILFLRPLRVDAGPFSPWGRALRNRRTLCDLIRSQLRQGQQSSQRPALLGQLAAAVAEGLLEEEDGVEEVLSLLLFGHDTAAATMAWAFAHIVPDAELVERLREEARAGEACTPVRPEALPLLAACIRESMRLCPVVVHLARTAAADLSLGGFSVRRGQKVIPCTYLAQHNPAVFPEPHRFRPERFRDGRRYEHAYFPFGFGSRTCVGKPFAMRQMLLVLSTALAAVDLELAPGYEPRPARHLVLIVPQGGARFRRVGE